MRANVQKFASGIKSARQQLAGFSSSALSAGRSFATFGGMLNASRINGLTTSVLGLGAGLGKISFAGFTAGLAGVTAGGIYLTKLASDAEETRNKFVAVFGDMSDDAMKWSDSFASVVQRSKFGVRTMMADMQDLLKPMGFNTKQATLMSKQVTQLAIDLASFGNLKDDEALLKLRSGLSGESEPLKALGINANETAVNLKLLEMGIKGGTASASEQQKVLARLAIIQEATAKKGAIGDAAKTANSVANSFKGLTGRLTDLGTEIGYALLPVAGEMLSTFKGWIPTAEGIKQVIGSWDLVGMFKNLREWVYEVSAGFQLMGARVLGMVGGVGGLSDGFTTVKEIANALLDTLFNFDLTWEMMGLTALKAIKTVWSPISNLSDNIGKFLGWLGEAWHSSWYDIGEIVLGVLDNLGQNIRGFGEEIWKAISSGFDHEIDTTKFTKSLVDGIHTTMKKPEFKSLLDVDLSYEDMRLGQLGDEFANRKQEQMKLANEMKARNSSPIPTLTPEVVDASKLIDIKELAGDSKLKQDATKLKEELKSPIAKYTDEIKKLTLMYNQKLITTGELNKARDNLKEKYKINKPVQFASAIEFGTQEARSAILRHRFGKNTGIDRVAENTKQTADFHKWQRTYVLRQTKALESKQTVSI